MSGEKKKQDPAVELLYDNIGALPDPDFGNIHLLPFLQETDHTKALKLKVCQAVVRLFKDAGYPMGRSEESKPVVLHDVAIHCRSCSGLLLKTHVDSSGRANVPAANVIEAISKRAHECPHDVITPEIQRQHMEQAFLASQETGA